jgi:hypothetical protein
VVTRTTTVYIDADLLTQTDLDAVALASEVGLVAIVVEAEADLPADLTDAWHLTARRPAVGSPRWSRTVIIGPRPEPGRVAHTGLRSARDLRVSLLEIASEATLD